MAVDDGLADRKADADAGRLGGEEGLEQPRLDLRGKARTVVDHLDQHAVLPVLRRPQRDLAAAARRQRVDAVAHQVHHHLLDLHPVDLDRRQAVGELEARPDTAPVDADQGELGCLPHQGIDRGRRLFGLALGDEAAQMLDDLPGAARLVGGLRHQLAGLAGRRRLPLQEPPARLQIVDDRGQRLVQLMGQRRGHLAHLGEARDMQELVSELDQIALGGVTFGNVANEAREQALLAECHLADRELDREHRAVLLRRRDLAADADDPLLPGPQIARDVAVMLRMEGRRHQAVDVAADDLRRLIAEHPLGARIEGADQAGSIDRHQAVWRGLEDRAQHRGLLLEGHRLHGRAAASRLGGQGDHRSTIRQRRPGSRANGEDRRGKLAAAPLRRPGWDYPLPDSILRHPDRPHCRTERPSP
jgi:hypothetical protein